MDVLDSVVSGGGLSWGELLTYVMGTVVLIPVLQAVFGLVRMLVVRQRHLAVIKDYTGPKGHWLMGNAAELTPDGGQLERQRLQVKYHRPLKFVLGPYVCVVLNDPEFIKVLCNSSGPKDEVAYKFLKPWIGDSLLVSTGHKWQRNRRLLTPAFHFDILKSYLTIFSKSSNTLIDKWKKLCQQKQCLEMFEHTSKMTMDSLMKCCFSQDGLDCQLEGKNPYMESAKKVVELVILRFSQPQYQSDLLYYLSWNGYKFRQAIEGARSFSRSVIQKRKKAIGEQQFDGGVKKKHVDFLDILLGARDEDGEGLTEQEIQEEVDTFMFAGHDTTASGISWCLYQLAMHKEYQHKCREEVQQVLGDRDTVLWEDLSKLEYLTMCLKESMRIIPPIPLIGRKLDKPMKLPDGKVIPIGFWMAIGIYQLHHNPDVWADPEVYDPERFNPDNSKKRHSHSFLPFSAGPRNCIGQHFAMYEMKTTLALILKHFLVEYTQDKPPDVIVDIVVRSISGIWLTITPIS